MKTLIKLPALLMLLCSAVLMAQTPTIESFSPESGNIGTTVTITGTNFDATATNNVVYFGAAMATVVSGTITELVVEVPAGSTYKPISVLSNGLIAYSTDPFAVTFESNGAISTSPGTFADNQYFLVDNFTYYIDFGDIDLDGKQDMLIASEGEYLIYRNTSSGIGNISFAPEVSVISGSDYVNDMKVADFDGDGKLDVATVTEDLTQTNYHLSVDRNNGIGAGVVAFTNDVFTALNSVSYSIDIGDVNKDGKIDIVVTDEENNQVSVYKNTSTIGAISFAAPVNFTVGKEPWMVKLADINNDTLLDIITVNYADTTISVLKNSLSDGSISFDTKVDFATNVDDEAESLAIGDLNGDGLPEILVKNINSISVFKNLSGAGIAMESPMKINLDDVGYGYINFADFNGDGKPDLLINPDNTNVGVYQNTSSGGDITIEGVQKYDVHAFQSNYSTSADLDGDGEPDIISASTNAVYTENYINIYRNKHSATQIEEFSFAEQTEAAVIDNDNRTINIGVTGLQDLTNLTASFTLSPMAQANIVSVAQTSGVTVNDFTNPVIYTITAEDDTTVVDWTVTVTLECAVEYDTIDIETCGSYSFYGNELTNSGTYNKTYLNRFGCDSIVTLNLIINPTHYYENVYAVGSYNFNGTILTESGQYTDGPHMGSTGCDSTYVLNLSVTPDMYDAQSYLRFYKSDQEFTGIVGGIFIGDLDGDNDDDFLICGNKSYADNNYVSFIYENDGNGNFTENTSPFGNISSTSKSSKLLDIDGDGDLDFLLFGYLKTGITIDPISRLYINDGSGNFTAKSNANLPVVEDVAIDTADVDGDGDIDFLINGQNGVEITELWLNDGNEVFSKDESSIFITSFNGSVNFLDVDNDGDQDVFVTGDSDASQNAKLYINDGDGNFTLRENLPFLGVTTSIVTVFDVDGDNDQDIFVTGHTHDAENNDFAIIYINDGNGYYAADKTSLIPEFKNGDVKTADIDNDGNIDLIISGDIDVHTLDEGDTTLVYLNNGFGHFMPSVQCGLANYEYSFIAVNDWNNDGRTDFLINGYTDNSIKTELYLNNEFSNEIDIVACTSFDFDGSTLTESGIYEGMFDDGMGCIFPVILNLTISTDDSCTTSSILNIEEEEFKVYPNPVSDILNIEKSSDDYTAISIIDMMGRVVVYEAFETIFKQINVSELNAGTYILKLEDGVGVASKEVIIIKK